MTRLEWYKNDRVTKQRVLRLLFMSPYVVSY